MTIIEQLYVVAVLHRSRFDKLPEISGIVAIVFSSLRTLNGAESYAMRHYYEC
ncbi:Hypothetical protein DAL_71 [Psychrobacter phage D'Alembert]|nr:Hypothetical protein DAL_71 [Psychrobacter phage D'Alembert]